MRYTRHILLSQSYSSVRRLPVLLLAAFACLLFLAACQTDSGTRTPATPRPARTSPPQITPTPTPAGPAVVGTILLRQGVGSNPSDLWLDEVHHRLYVLCTDELDIVDTTTNRVSRVAIPAGVRILAVDAQHERVLLGGAGGSGPSALFVADGRTGAIVQKIDLPAPPWRTLFLPDRDLAVVALTPGRIAAVNVAEAQVAFLEAGGSRPIMAADAEAGKVYLSGAASAQGVQTEDALTVLDVRSGQVTIVPLPAPSTALAVHPRFHRLFILHQYEGSLSTYTPDGGLGATLSLGGELTEIAVDASQNSVYVVDWAGARVLLLDAGRPSAANVMDVSPGGHLATASVTARRLFLSHPEALQLTLIQRDKVAATMSLPAPAGNVAVQPNTGVAYVAVPDARLLLALAPDGAEFLRWTLPGRPEGMALDSAQGKLFLSLPGSDALAVVDLNTRNQDVIPHALVPSAVTLNPADGLLYLAEPRGAVLYAFSPDRGQMMRSVSVGPQPQILAVNQATGELLVVCSDGLYSVAANAAQAKQIVAADAAPLVAVSAKLNRIYVGLVGPPSAVQVLDGATQHLLRTVNLSGELFYLGADEETGRVLAVWRSPAQPDNLGLSLLDGQTLEEHQVSAPLAVPSGAEVAACWDSARGKVGLAVGGRNGRVYTVDSETGAAQFVAEFRPVEDVPAVAAPFALACDSSLGKAYLGVYGRDQLLVVDSRSAISTTVALPSGVTALAVDLVRSRVYASLVDETLAILDGRSGRLVESVPLGGGAHLLLADPRRERVFASDPLGAVVRIVHDPILEPAPSPSPTPAPSGTTQAPISPWTNFANGDSVRILISDGRHVWAGTADGGIVRWSVSDGTFRQFLSPQDGLRSNQIHGLVVRSSEEVWAATGKGLGYYNGFFWATYSSRDAEQPLGPVRSLTVDQFGRAWIGTEDGGVSVFDGQRWSSFSADKLGLQGNWVTEIAVDGRGRAWLGSWMGVGVLDTSGIVTYTAQNSGLPPGVVGALLVMTDGAVWAGTDGGIAVFQSGAWTAFPTAGGAPDHVTALAQTADGILWAASPSGIHRYDGSHWKAAGTVQKAAENYASLWANLTARSQKWPIVSAGGKVWAILESGLADFDGQVWTRRSTTGASPPSNQARALALGAGGGIWAGFAGSGAARYSGGRWEVFAGRDRAGLNVNAVLSDAQGRTWFATDEGVSQYDGQRWAVYKAGEGGLLNGRALALAWDPAGTLWVGTEQGLNAWRREAWTAYTTANSGLPNNRVLALAVGADGSLWCATSGGVSRYDGKDWQTFTDPSAGATEQEIWAVALGEEGYRWFGARQGVRRLSGESWFNYRDAREAVEYDHARILNTRNNPNGLWTVDQKRGKIWMPVEGGAAAYNGREWEVYTPANSGLTSDKVRAILVDDGGAVWFATDKGISRLSP